MQSSIVQMCKVNDETETNTDSETETKAEIETESESIRNPFKWMNIKQNTASLIEHSIDRILSSDFWSFPQFLCAYAMTGDQNWFDLQYLAQWLCRCSIGWFKWKRKCGNAFFASNKQETFLFYQSRAEQSKRWRMMLYNQ